MPPRRPPRRIAVTALGLLLLSCRGALAAGDVHDVSIVCDLRERPGASVLWEPYIAESATGPVVAFGAGIPGKGDMGDILVCRSSDSGRTWKPPVVILDHTRGSFAYANPILYRPPDQTAIWCFAMRCPLSRKNSENSKLCAMRSEDGGRSWRPVELKMDYDGPLIVVAGILRLDRPDGPLYLLPAHRNTLRADPHGSRDQFVLSSRDLIEWRLAGTVPQPATGPIFLHEGSIAPGERPGELKMVMRTSDYRKEGTALRPPRAYSSISRDDGRTWSPAAPEPDLYNAVAKAFYGRFDGDRHIYVYNDGPAWSRMALRYKVQLPAGVWGEERTFFDSGTHNSYPTLIETAPGEFDCVWDSGTAKRVRTCIRFGRLSIAPSSSR